MSTYYKATYKSKLATKFGVSLETFNIWIQDIPELKISKRQRLLTPLQVKIITEHLQEPSQ